MNTINSNRLSGKVAIVTGSSKGLGAQIAKQFARQGTSVIVNYSSSKAAADAVVLKSKTSAERRKPFRRVLEILKM